MKWTVVFRSSADRDFGKVDPRYKATIAEKAKALEFDPFPHGVKKLKGRKNLYRVRIGVYRLCYESDPKAHTLYVYQIDNRKDVDY